MGLGRSAWSEARAILTELLSADCPTLRDNTRRTQRYLPRTPPCTRSDWGRAPPTAPLSSCVVVRRVQSCMHALKDVVMELPARVAVTLTPLVRNHAYNVGVLLRGGECSAAQLDSPPRRLSRPFLVRRRDRHAHPQAKRTDLCGQQNARVPVWGPHSSHAPLSARRSAYRGGRCGAVWCVVWCGLGPTKSMDFKLEVAFFNGVPAVRWARPLP